MANAAFDAFGNVHRARNVGRKDRRRQAIFAIIGDPNGFIFVSGTNDNTDRTKAFFGIDPHRGRDVIQKRCVHQNTVFGLCRSGDEFGALGYRVFNQVFDAFNRFDADDTAKNMFALGRITSGQGFGFGGKLGDKVIGDRIIDDKTFGRHANLSLVHIGTKGRPIDRLVKVRVIKYQEWRLAPQFKKNRFKVLGPEFGNDPTYTGGAGKVDATYCWMGNQGFDDFRRVFGGVGHHIDDASRRTGLDHALGNQVMQGRAKFGCLKNDGITTGKRHGDCARAQNDRRIPWCNPQNNANRLTHTHGHQARGV